MRSCAGRWACFALLATALTLATTTARAATAPATSLSTDPALGSQTTEVCRFEPSRAASEIAALADRIRAARTLEEARQIAMSDSSLARGALRRARFFAPNSPSISRASARIDDFHAAIAAAGTRGEMTRALDRLTPAPRVAADCDFTTGELIAIVLGFVLGIIPGIILLILLC